MTGNFNAIPSPNDAALPKLRILTGESVPDRLPGNRAAQGFRAQRWSASRKLTGLRGISGVSLFSCSRFRNCIGSDPQKMRAVSRPSEF